MSAIKKHFNIKVYDFAGTYIKSFSPDVVMNNILFSSEANAGFGECVINLALPFDNFDEGNSINFENIIKVYEYDDVNHSSGTLIFTGVVMDYTPVAGKGLEFVELSAIGLLALLSRSFFKNGASFTVDYTGGVAADPGTMIKDIIDHFNTIYGGKLLEMLLDGLEIGKTKILVIGKRLI